LAFYKLFIKQVPYGVEGKINKRKKKRKRKRKRNKTKEYTKFYPAHQLAVNKNIYSNP